MAGAVGISHAAPYRHFPERGDFLAALAALCMAEFVQSQREALQSTRKPAQRLIEMGAAYVDYGVVHPRAFQLIFDTEVSPPGQPPPELAPLIAEHAAMLHTAVFDAVRAGALSAAASPEVLAMSLWSQVHGMAHLVIEGRLDAGLVHAILAASLLP